MYVMLLISIILNGVAKVVIDTLDNIRNRTGHILDFEIYCPIKDGINKHTRSMSVLLYLHIYKPLTKYIHS